MQAGEALHGDSTARRRPRYDGCGMHTADRLHAKNGIWGRMLLVLADDRGLTGFPVVTLSWAQTPASVIAAARGARTTLSSAESLAFTHRLRGAHDGILAGIGTVLADDPLLSVRLAAGRQPRPVILDTRLRTPPSARLLARTDRSPWIFHGEAPGDAARELAARGARLFRVRETGSGLDLDEVLAALAAEGIRSLMVEGGALVLRAFIAAHLARQAVVTVCPREMDGYALFEEGRAWRKRLDFSQSLEEAFGIDTVVWGLFDDGRTGSGAH